MIVLASKKEESVRGEKTLVRLASDFSYFTRQAFGEFSWRVVAETALRATLQLVCLTN
jgi:hypothetical protein